MQTHAGQEPESAHKKLELIAAVFFELSRKRWKLTPMITDVITMQITVDYVAKGALSLQRRSTLLNSIHPMIIISLLVVT